MIKKQTFKRRLAVFALYIIYILIKFLFHRSRYSNELQNLKMTQNNDDPFNFNGYKSTLDETNHWVGRRLMGISVIRPHPSLNCTPSAMENFPKDKFTQSQRQHGAVIIHFLTSIYMFVALAILCDEYFIPCLERICEVLNLQPDVAGATFMAAGSSAPELATTLVGVFIAKDDIGLGAVVGSADFNIMLVISVTALFAKQVIYLNWWPLVRDSTVYLLSIILLACVIYDERIYWYESALFLIFYALYVILMYFNPRVDAFWRNWCREHPACCPRAMHLEERDLVQQHSGVFGHSDVSSSFNVDNFDSDAKLKGNMNPYKRLDSAKENEFLSEQLEKGDLTNINPSNEKFGGIETEIHPSLPTETWFDTLFSSLKLPSSQGIRGKIRLTYHLLIWPLRLILCLTIPDLRKSKWKSIPASHWLSFSMSCFWIGVFTIIMMWMITVIGVTLHIPDTIMGLTLIAAGSSVPDAIASVLVVREGEGDMAVSNAIGSNVFDILVCMGLPWFLKSLFSQTSVSIYSKGLLYATITLFTTVIFLLVATHLNRWRLTKPYGYALLIGYVIVLIFCSLYELNYFGIVRLPQCDLKE